MGILQRAVTLILRCQSKFSHVKSHVSTHSACPYKNYLPKCSQSLQTLFTAKKSFFFYLVCNKATRTLSRKKNVRKPPHSWAGCLVEPYNASRQPIHQFWPKWVMVVTLLCARGPAPHVAWAENIANAWLPIQTYGVTSKGRNFNSKVWIKIPQGQIFGFDPFCVPM